MDHTEHHLAVHRLMVWALSHVRSSYHRIMYGPDTAKRSAKELNTIMHLPYKYMRDIGETALPPAMAKALHALPPDYLALICCIACETLTTPSMTAAEFAEVRRLGLDSITEAIHALTPSSSRPSTPTPSTVNPSLGYLNLMSLVLMIVAC